MKFAFEDLLVWKEAVTLSKEIYLRTKQFPRSELFGLTSQLRRSAISISLNIAEGKGRRSKKEFQQFLYVARGSLYETITSLKICFELEYLTKEHLDTLIKKCESILSKLSGLINSIN